MKKTPSFVSAVVLTFGADSMFGGSSIKGVVEAGVGPPQPSMTAG
jgi:hypothetical protein